MGSYRYSCNKNLIPGLNNCVTPQNSVLKLLSYYRIILDERVKNINIESKDQEFFLFNLKEISYVNLNKKTFPLGKLDGIYIPPHQKFSLNSKKNADIYVFSAPATQSHSPRFISYPEVSNNPSLHYFLGKEETHDRREQFIYLYSKISASRLLFGFARADPGSWSSVPPHKHTELMEEMYIFFDMEDSLCGIQFVYDDDKNLHHSYFIKNGDAVIIPYGYHPNVSFPKKRVNFMWAMASHQEGNRKLVINIQPELCTDGKRTIESF